MKHREQDFQQDFNGSIFEGMFKTATDLMLTNSKFWFGNNGSDSSKSSEESFQDFQGFNLQELFTNMAKTGQAIFTAWKDNESAQEAIDELNKLSEATLKMARAGMDNYFQMQQELLKGVGQAGDSMENFHIDAGKDNPFSAFLSDYETFFSKYFNAPKLGLLRYYEEKRDRAVDKYNLMLASVGEFFYLLYIPLAKSINVMQKKFEEMNSNGELSDNPKDYYQMWIKTLEGDYLSMFRSREFLSTAHKALNAFEDFNSEVQNLSNDILQYSPLPSQRELDELAEENYKMKKQLKNLKKEVQNLQSAQVKVS